MRALPRPSRITILAVCLATVLAAILVIGCMRVMDGPDRTAGRPAAPESGAAASVARPDAVPAESPAPGVGSAVAPAPRTGQEDFSRLVEPLAAVLFVIPARPGAVAALPQAVPAPEAEKPVRETSQSADQATAAPGKPAEPAPQVQPPAIQPRAQASASRSRSILVVGDSFAVGIGMTMAESLRQAKDVRLDQKGKTSSGLDNAKFHNWGKTLEGLLSTARPDALVVMIGGNDAQNGPGNQVWADSYRQKAAEFLGIAAKRQVPVYWVALPPMREPGLNARVKTANTAMRAACEAGPDCRFIDSWDIFADAKGDYAEEKTVDGKTVKLRGKDGVHFTMTGYKLLSDRVLAGFSPNLELSQKK